MPSTRVVWTSVFKTRETPSALSKPITTVSNTTACYTFYHGAQFTIVKEHNAAQGVFIITSGISEGESLPPFPIARSIANDSVQLVRSRRVSDGEYEPLANAQLLAPMID